MDDTTQLKADTIQDFLGWLLGEKHGADGEFAVGLWKGVDRSEMQNWAPNHKALVYDYLGLDSITGEPLDPA